VERERGRDNGLSSCRSFIHPFTHSFIHPSIHSLIHSPSQPVIQSEPLWRYSGEGRATAGHHSLSLPCFLPSFHTARPPASFLRPPRPAVFQAFKLCRPTHPAFKPARKRSGQPTEAREGKVVDMNVLLSFLPSCPPLCALDLSKREGRGTQPSETAGLQWIDKSRGADRHAPFFVSAGASLFPSLLSASHKRDAEPHPC